MGDAESLAGRVLAGKYRLSSRLGEGGFGSIWRAEHLALRSPIAVKLIDLDMARRDGAVERFLREAQATAALRSPHVVQVLDYGVDGEQPFIVMELLEGENLAERLERVKRLSPLEVVRVVTHVARAVGKAHELGIVHRDLKPENIFIVNTGDEELVKVLDFGVAKFATAPELNRNTYTKTGALIGTPYYMSPEQAQGNKTVDSRSDLWALGVIAFEMITGQRPFDGDALGDLVLTICVRSISVPSAVAPVPDGFDAWFAKAVERNPDARFQTAREMALALLRIVEGDSVDGMSLGLDERSNLPPVAVASDIAVEIPSRPLASAFAATVRDESSVLSGMTGNSIIGPQPNAPAGDAVPQHEPPFAPWNPSATNASPLGLQTVNSFGTNHPAPPPPAANEDADAEEHLPPWAVVGIALLALMAGASVVYGAFFLLRAHDASNDPLDESSSVPVATASSEARSAKSRIDVTAPSKPNHSPEQTQGRSVRSNAASTATASATRASTDGSHTPKLTLETAAPLPAGPLVPGTASTTDSTVPPPVAPPAELMPAPDEPAAIPPPTLEVQPPADSISPPPLPVLSAEPQQPGAPDPAASYDAKPETVILPAP